MKRNLTVAAIIIICFLLQTTVFQALSFATISPNLMIIVTSSFGFMRGKKEGMVIGFFCGLLIDIFFGNLVGLYALVYMYIGYVNGLFRTMFYPEDIKLPIILISVSDIICNLSIFIFQFLLRGKFNFFFYLKSIILPELVYTILVTVFLYFIILRINHKLEMGEKRSVTDLV
ncbi:MAG: rod shape-determining protein MreD [Lachnospiraceae bacterium]